MARRRCRFCGVILDDSDEEISAHMFEVHDEQMEALADESGAADRENTTDEVAGPG